MGVGSGRGSGRVRRGEEVVIGSRSYQDGQTGRQAGGRTGRKKTTVRHGRRQRKGNSVRSPLQICQI